MIVVDANIVAYWVIEGDKTPLARRLRSLHPVWVVPSLCRHELASVLSVYFKHGGMDADDVAMLWESFTSVIEGHEYETAFPEAIMLARDHDISAYDAQYVLLAHQLSKPLITEDKKLCTQCPDKAQSMSQYLGMAGA